MGSGNGWKEEEMKQKRGGERGVEFPHLFSSTLATGRKSRHRLRSQQR